MGNLFIKYKQMGGVPVKPVDCTTYSDGEVVDADLYDYIKNGLIPEAEIMIYYGWHSFGQYIWYLNTSSYFNTMQMILDCSVQEGVDSQYANEDWMTNMWGVAFLDYFVPEGEILGLWWHPAIVIATMLPYPPFFAWWTWLANIVWIIVNVIMGLDRQDISINYYMQWIGELEVTEEVVEE